MWRTVKLGDIATWVRGLTYSKNDEVENDGIAVLRATNIDLATHKIVLDEIRYVSDTVKVKEDKYTQVGDLLVCTASGSKSHVGKVAIVEEDLGMAFGGFMAALRCNEHCFPRFLYHVLTSQKFKWHLQNLGDGANINNLKFSQIESYELPLPPLAEQQRIVAKLDAAFAEIDRAIEATEESRRLHSQVIDAGILKKLESLPKTCFQKFESFCSFVRGPFGGSLKKSMFVDEGYAVYEQQHPINNQFESFRYFITEEKYAEMNRFAVKPNDVLMSCSGVTLGRVGIVPMEAPKGIINQALLKISPKESLSSEYLQLLMRSDIFQKLIWSVSGGAAQPNVPPIKVIKELLLPIPSREIQNDLVKWASTLKSFDASSKLESKIHELSVLKSAILAQELQPPQSEAA